MAKRKRKKKSAEDLGTENELMKLKMMAEFGGNFVGGEDLSAEVENQFLKQIISFHKMHENSGTTTVYQFIGEPEYNHVNDMSDKEIKKELKRLLKLMDKNGVSLSVLADTPEREVYRFVTEELFKHEIENVKVKGWVNQFIYEEFYPNANYDIKTAVSYCLQSLFNKGSAFYEEYYHEEMKDAIGLSMEHDDLRDKIENFWSNHHDVKLDEYNFDSVEVNTEKTSATVTCTVNYKTQKAKGRRYKTETTVIELSLEKSNYMDSWWEVKQIICDLF